MIESDLNVLPKDNLCILDASDPDLDYKLANAAVHGLAVLLKNSERYAPSKLVSIIIERDFLFDSVSGKEYIKFDEAELVVSPIFRLVLHANAPLCFFSVSSARAHPNNNLFGRLTTRSNAAHFVLDFAPSHHFVARDLLASIMEFEKYGYANQLSLADKILFEAEFNIFNRQEEIIERLNTIDQSILDDKDMVAYANEKNTKLREFKDSCSESLYIE